MNDELIQDQELPSKTQRKKEMIALQEIGARLTTFKKVQLDALPLSDKLRIALGEYNRLPNSHEAKRRQLQYIGRLMRDHDLESIESAIDKLLQPNPESASSEKILDDQCAMVFNEGEAGISALINEHQFLERQALRKFYLDYCKLGDDPDPQHREQLKSRLLKYLKNNQ